MPPAPAQSNAIARCGTTRVSGDARRKSGAVDHYRAACRSLSFTPSATIYSAAGIEAEHARPGAVSVIGDFLASFSQARLRATNYYQRRRRCPSGVSVPARGATAELASKYFSQNDRSPVSLRA